MIPAASIAWAGGERLSADPSAVERREAAFYAAYVKSGMVVLDVGASIGTLTIAFARQVGSTGRVHAFEPTRNAFDAMLEGCRDQGLSNVCWNCCAVSDRQGSLDLHVYDDAHLTWNTLADRPLHRYGIDVRPIEVASVPATTIDAYCEQMHVRHIDLLKIDVEGAELQVVRGARGMFERRAIGCCVFEFGQTTFDMGNDPDELESIFTRFGYVVSNIVPGDPVFPGRLRAETARFAIHLARPQP